MLLQRHHSRACRKKHKTRTQAQRVFKTASQYAVTNPEESAPQDIWTAFTSFFESLWNPTTAATQKSGMSYAYDEDGTLIAQTLTGGAQSSWGQSARYVYLPTASGPMPVAAIYGAKHYAIQSDHLNTPRRLIQSDGQVAWQWAYSAFGDEKPTIAKNRFANTDLNQSFGTSNVPAVTFNLRYPGQYYDQESNLHYNYHRSYSATVGRYTQADPIGLDGGWNRFNYAELNPLEYTDPTGEFGVPGAIAGGVIGAIGGASGAYVNGGNVWRGALLGGLGGIVVGGLGPVIGPGILGQAVSRVTAGALGNVLGQGQEIGTGQFCGFNYASIAGSALGGALGATVAPASYGVQFTGSLASQIIPRAISGVPGAGYSVTGNVIGTQSGVRK